VVRMQSASSSALAAGRLVIGTTDATTAFGAKLKYSDKF